MRTKKWIAPAVAALALINTHDAFLSKGSNLLWAGPQGVRSLTKYAVERHGLTLSPAAKDEGTGQIVDRLFEQLGSEDHPSSALLDMSFEQLRAVADRFKHESRSRVHFKDSKVFIVSPQDLSSELLHATGKDAAKHLAQRLEGVLKDAASEKKKVFLFVSELGKYLEFLTPTLAKLQHEKNLQIVGSVDSSNYAEVVEKDERLKRIFATVPFEKPKANTVENEISSIRDSLVKRSIKVGEGTIQPIISDDVVRSLPVAITSNFPTGVDVVGTARTVLERAIGVWKNEASKQAQEQGTYSPAVTMEHISKAIGAISRKPVEKSDQQHMADLKTFEARLGQHVMGQDEAKYEMAEVARESGGGLYDPDRPRSTSIFVGPTGVGKTELAKAFAREYLGDENAFLYFNMNEYMTEGHATKLVGAPPMYIGHEKGGELTNKLKKYKKVVVLFDEIEKAHQKVWDVLMQFIEEGRITSGEGDQFTAEGREIHIILTTNLGQDITLRVDLSPQQKKDEIFKELLKFFRKETLNRVDSIVPFQPLTKAQLREILRKEIKKDNTRLPGLKTWDTKIEVQESAENVLVALGWRPDLGARPLRTAIKKHLRRPLNSIFIDLKSRGERLPMGTTISVSAEKGESADTTKMKVSFLDAARNEIGTSGYVLPVSYDEIQKVMSGDQNAIPTFDSDVADKVDAEDEEKAKRQKAREDAEKIEVPVVSDGMVEAAKQRIESLIATEKEKHEGLRNVEFNVNSSVAELFLFMEGRTDQPKQIFEDSFKHLIAKHMDRLEAFVKQENAKVIGESKDPEAVQKTTLELNAEEFTRLVPNTKGKGHDVQYTGQSALAAYAVRDVKNTNEKIKAKTISNSAGPVLIPVTGVAYALFERFVSLARAGQQNIVADAPSEAPKKSVRSRAQELLEELKRLQAEDSSAVSDAANDCGMKL